MTAAPSTFESSNEEETKPADDSLEEFQQEAEVKCNITDTSETSEQHFDLTTSQTHEQPITLVAEDSVDNSLLHETSGDSVVPASFPDVTVESDLSKDLFSTNAGKPS